MAENERVSSSSGEEESGSEEEELPPLHSACQEGNAAEVEHLLTNGNGDGGQVDVNEVLEGNYAAIYIAACTNQTEIVKLLLDHKADAGIAEEETGESALTVAVQQGFEELVEVLLDGHANPNARNKAGASAVFIAGLQGRAEIAQKLISARADVDVPKMDGATPAIISASKGWLVLVFAKDKYFFLYLCMFRAFFVHFWMVAFEHSLCVLTALTLSFF